MEFSAQQISELVNGEIEGNSSIKINGLAKIEEGTLGKLSFLANPKYEEYIYTTKSSVCIVNKTFVPNKTLPTTLTLIKVDDAYGCFTQLLHAYDQMKRKKPQIEPNAYIAKTAILGEDIYVGANAYISEGVSIGKNVQIYPNSFIGDNVKIGNNTIIHPNVSIYADCKIGNNCVIHSGAVIGADGFGFNPDENGVFGKIPQIGIVILEDNVDIGANSTIDRATMGATVIRKGVKIDNLCQIGHNVEIDENSAMAAQVGIAGSTKIGKHVLLGGQVGISGHIRIADQTKIAAQSGIANSIKQEKTTVMGAPAIPIEDFKKSYMGFRKLPEILSKLRELENKLKEIESHK